jgi:hypothetical protein
VVSFEAFAHLVMLISAMPLLLALFVRYLHDADNANLLLMKICVFFHLVGTFMMGISDRPVTIFLGKSLSFIPLPIECNILTAKAIGVSMIGSGFGSAARSWLTSLVPKEDIALLYTLFAIAASIGAITGAPLLAYLFSLGIRLGGWLTGLPFFAGTALYVICAVCVWSIPSQTVADVEEEN